MGLKWNAFVRSTDLTSEEAEVVLGDDWFGDWIDDVVSDASYDILGQHFDAIKLTRMYYFLHLYRPPKSFFLFSFLSQQSTTACGSALPVSSKPAEDSAL